MVRSHLYHFFGEFINTKITPKIIIMFDKVCTDLSTDFVDKVVKEFFLINNNNPYQQRNLANIQRKNR
ncbi:hypothetical protein clem_06750 [Legionella clemsonensis]|uniref:Uncharacterized protein n=1 Tax=Legionella clemsonensis TaxID=1867846 RepID=A0A222P2B5_9GAMM|nr:hypothetical protein clem_06750 [Legionella clemsonensis]